jgi:GNAT superfamily N-acetyltransferase
MSQESEGIAIREGTENDSDGIIACLAAAFEPYRTIYTADAYRDTVPNIEGVIKRLEGMKVFVAEVHPAMIIGTVACQVVGHGEGHLRGMAVIPEYQGRGVADRLLEAVETALLKSGCSRVTLDTTRPLERAVRFYLRNGYRASGRVDDYFGMPLFEYEKILKN